MSDALLVGLDVGGTSVKGIAVRADHPSGPVVAEIVLPTDLGEAGVRAGVHHAVSALAEAGHVAGIGVGVPGFVVDGRTSHAVNLGLGAEPVDLRTTLAPLTDGPVHIQNDVKTAALGTRSWLASSDPAVDDYALLNVGTGLAAGLVLQGRLRDGATGIAGEIGHLVFDRGGPTCPCGQVGCLELYASGSGLRRRWAGTAGELFRAAAAGDTEARAIATELTDGIGQAITLLAYCPDVALIVVTGGVVTATPALRSAVDARIARDDRELVGRAVPVADRVRWLPADVPVGARGAALLVAEGGS